MLVVWFGWIGWTGWIGLQKSLLEGYGVRTRGHSLKRAALYQLS